MRKESLYFSHDSNAKTDSKILRIRAIHGWEGYGMYWAVIEVLREQSGYKYLSDESELQLLAKMLDMEWTKFNKFFKDCLHAGLFKLHEKFFVSESLLNRMRLREANRINGSKGGKSRLHLIDDEDVKPTLSGTISESEANFKPKRKESKRKERKEEEKEEEKNNISENKKPDEIDVKNFFYENGFEENYAEMSAGFFKQNGEYFWQGLKKFSWQDLAQKYIIQNRSSSKPKNPNIMTPEEVNDYLTKSKYPQPK